ncbi:A disintegrin and metalloproteinase with thrombospondin motifs 2 isoform X1 [Tribolium castaneum]|uniref:A disintegrin and metalloproteinase with thrombospondin motifs 2 isoform X1 n=2 Tax=Tribolium castaneum TaxID=7070 RepID=UPI00077DD1A6|nr:PREDICTED: A disintegrin and metalloproteinase with thrombospondin motifs 2 isoform X1 [Tribolium castaneum]|eukprot:XP_015839228.1 PREDICTED: A disintegrin and metalloproteinase with thrombospondin motifs 2 isoform X1 [Tribolium castaneum]
MCPLLVGCLVIAILSGANSDSRFFDAYSEIVYPRIFERTIRVRRDIYSNVYTEESTTLKMMEVGDWTLELNSESNLVVAPALRAEWVDSDGNVTFKDLSQCDYKLGVVRSLETLSRAAVTLCGRYVIGYIAVGDLVFFLQPTNGTQGEHRLDRQAITKSRLKRHSDDIYFEQPQPEQWLFNLTGDVIDIEGSTGSIRDNASEEDDLEEKFTTSPLLSWRREQLEDEELGYFYDTAWTADAPKTRKSGSSLLPPRWLEIALAVDHTLIQFHGKDKVEQYVLALMNIVNAIYQDPSLEANMRLVVTRLLLYEHRKQSIVRPGDAKKSLENANSWNSRLHASLAPDESHHDIAVWLTRSDIGGPSGYAPVAGACDPKRSCALNRDEGLTSAFIIAHEMAHVLGLSHDGDKKHSNHCGDESAKGSVMAPLVAATFHQFFWSQCSRKEFKKIVKKWTCLSNSPAANGEIVLNATLQNAFSMDEQCRMEFGDGFSLCRAFDIIEPCSHLWCGHERAPLVCKTKKGSPLEGTQCGFNKWCWNGYCEDMDTKISGHIPVILNPQDGGWSNWSPWGPCSRSCGTGVQFQTRKCNNPTPSHGGDNCEGVSEKWRICNNKPCPEPLGDMRAQQCKRLPKLLDLSGTRAGNMTWLPYESEDLDKKCKLICISENTKELFESSENLIDGTPCSYENSDNICIQGVCQFLGCDGQLFSKVKTDMCGVCGGNNSNCSNIESIFRRKLKREVSRVAVLPRMATRIKLEANVTMHNKDEPSVAFILKNRRKKKYTITVPNTGLRADIIEGTKFYYEKSKNKHKIWANGPVLAEMVVLVYAPISEIEEGLNVSLRSEYIINKDVSFSSARFKWILGGWGPCSASCGGGRRQKTVACWDNHNQKLVRRKHCSLMTKPTLTTEKCNTFDCHFQWVPGTWEFCSATCGLTGVQQREIYCVPQAMLNKIASVNETWRYMVNPTKCLGVSPLSKRPCNRIPCESYWTYGEWSQVFNSFYASPCFDFLFSVLKAAAKDYLIARLIVLPRKTNTFTPVAKHLQLHRHDIAKITPNGRTWPAENGNTSRVLRINPISALYRFWPSIAKSEASEGCVASRVLTLNH